MRFSYDVVLDISRKGELLQVVTDVDGDGYIFNHENGTFNSIWDWDFLNTVEQILLSLDLDKDDWVWDMDYELVEKIYEDMIDEAHDFWRLYTYLHLERFNQEIFDEHFEKEGE